MNCIRKLHSQLEFYNVLFNKPVSEGFSPKYDYSDEVIGLLLTIP